MYAPHYMRSYLSNLKLPLLSPAFWLSRRKALQILYTQIYIGCAVQLVPTQCCPITYLTTRSPCILGCGEIIHLLQRDIVETLFSVYKEITPDEKLNDAQFVFL